MRKIIQWVTAIAEADRGTGLVPDGILDERLKALSYLERNAHAMEPVDLRETMTMAHFATYFGTALSRAFFDAYQYQAGQWPNYTYADEAPDFRDVDRGRMSEPGTLYWRGEKGEAIATDIEESWVHYGVQEYSRQMDFSWQTIASDDLGEIRLKVRNLAQAARRFEDGFVSALYDNAATQAALIALGAVYAGTGRLTAANLAIGINAMMQRTDGAGNPIQVSRIYLVYPAILQIQAADILRDLLQYGGPGGNVLASFISGTYIDPYINTTVGVPWYLFAAPQEIPCVPVVRYRDMPGPVVLETLPDSRVVSGTATAAFMLGSAATGNIEYQVVDIIGGWDDATWVGVVDPNGIYYSSGTTP